MYSIHVAYRLRVAPGNAIAGVSTSKVGHPLRASLSSGAERGWDGVSPKDAVKEKLIQSVVRPGTSLKKGPL